MFTIKIQVIQNMAHGPSTQASYTIGSGTTMQENQPAAQISDKHNIFSRMAPYMSWIMTACNWKLEQNPIMNWIVNTIHSFIHFVFAFGIVFCCCESPLRPVVTVGNRKICLEKKIQNMNWQIMKWSSTEINTNLELQLLRSQIEIKSWTESKLKICLHHEHQITNHEHQITNQ